MTQSLSGDSGHTLPMLVIGEAKDARHLAASQLAAIGVVSAADAVGENGDEFTAVPTGGLLMPGKGGAVDQFFAHVVYVMSNGKGKLYALDGDGGYDAEIEPFTWGKDVRDAEGDSKAPPPPAGAVGTVIRGTMHGSTLNNLYMPGAWNVSDYFDGSRGVHSTIWRDHDGTSPSRDRFAGQHTLIVLPFAASVGAAVLALNLESGQVATKMLTVVDDRGIAGGSDSSNGKIEEAMKGSGARGEYTPGTYADTVRRYYEARGDGYRSEPPPRPPFGLGGYFHDVDPDGNDSLGHLADVVFSDGEKCVNHVVGEMRGHKERGGHIRTTAPFKIQGDTLRDGPLLFLTTKPPKRVELAIKTKVHREFDELTGIWIERSSSVNVPVPPRKPPPIDIPPPPIDTPPPWEPPTTGEPPIIGEPPTVIDPPGDQTPGGGGDTGGGDTTELSRGGPLTTVPGQGPAFGGAQEETLPPGANAPGAPGAPLQPGLPKYTPTDDDLANEQKRHADALRKIEINGVKGNWTPSQEQQARDAENERHQQWLDNYNKARTQSDGGLTAHGIAIDAAGTRGVAYSVQSDGGPGYTGLPLPCPDMAAAGSAPRATYDPGIAADTQDGFAVAFDQAVRGLHTQYIAKQYDHGQQITSDYLSDGNPRGVGHVIECTLPPDKNAHAAAGSLGNIALSAASTFAQTRWTDAAVTDAWGGYPKQVSGQTQIVAGIKRSTDSSGNTTISGVSAAGAADQTKRFTLNVRTNLGDETVIDAGDIAANVLTLTGGTLYEIDGNATINNIAGGTPGDIIRIRATSGSTVVISHNAGSGATNVYQGGGADKTINQIYQTQAYVLTNTQGWLPFGCC